MVRRFFGLQDNVAALLVNDGIVPMTTERFNEFFSAQIPGNFHPLETISSRTRCKRIVSGLSRSK